MPLGKAATPSVWLKPLPPLISGLNKKLTSGPETEISVCRRDEGTRALRFGTHAVLPRVFGGECRVPLGGHRRLEVKAETLFFPLAGVDRHRRLVLGGLISRAVRATNPWG